MAFAIVVAGAVATLVDRHSPPAPSGQPVLTVPLAPGLASLPTGSLRAPLHGATGVNLGGAANAGFAVMPAARQAAVMADIASAGVTWLRVDVPFDGEALPQGGYDWTTTPEIRAAAAHGLSVDALLSYSPPWARGPHGEPDPVAFARFAGAAAAHLAPLGVTTFEVWNEPNLRSNWGAPVSATTYNRLLEDAAGSIRAAAPGSTVLSGGLAPATDDGSSAQSPISFLRQVVAAGRGRDFDGVAVHPYSYPDLPNTPDGWNQFHQLPKLEQVLSKAGLQRKPIWITEYGAPTSGSDAVSEVQQAAMMTEAWKDGRSWSWLGPIMAFDWQDNPVDGSFGVTTSTGMPKKAYGALVEAGQVARRADG
jgi:hypothetical protein